MSDDNAKKDAAAGKPPEDDFTVINPPNMLAAKVQKKSGTLDDLLKSADKMLKDVSFEFDQLMDDHVKQLTAIYAKWNAAETRAEAIKAYASIANSVKGNAGTFNYALLGKIADLFRDYLDDTQPADQKPAAILSYVNAMQVVWKQKITGDGGMLGKQMVGDLMKLNQKLSGPQG